MEEAELIVLLRSEGSGNRLKQKPENIYLKNPNLLYSLSLSSPRIGTVRDLFFLNQVSQAYTITFSDKGDFKVDASMFFEIGGRTKDFTQIANLPNSYLSIDDVEVSFGNRIPLYFFGFLN